MSNIAKITMTKKCKFCGQGFTTSTGEAYCSDRCRKDWFNAKAREKYQREVATIKTCLYCGEEFHPTRENRTFCCGLHKAEYLFRQPPKPQPESRLFTHDTVFLVHKWHEEGDSIEQIAKDLSRPTSDIEAALKVPLTLERRLAMEQYLISRKCA